MKRLLLIIAISCMPFLSGFAVAADTDTIPDALDNCPNVDNEDQKDTDGDRMGDVCDTDGITTIANPHDRYEFANTEGYERMGFGFAQPIITIIPEYVAKDDDGNITGYKPVVIIAGGYDPTKDYRGAYDVTVIGDPAIGSPSGDPVIYEDFVRGSGPSESPVAGKMRSEDKVGNAIYFLDALTGKVVARIVGSTNDYNDAAAPEGAISAIADGKAWAVTEAGQIVEAGLKHSIPATVTIMDSQGDGITDRVYFIDVVGNVWRLDLNPTDDETYISKKWRLELFASLGAEDKTSGTYAANERRFFNQIDVVRTRKPGGNTNVDALLVGSGNIANPKEDTAAGQNAFFMIYDGQTQPLAHGVTARTIIKLEHLYPVPAADNNANAALVKADLVSSSKGWYLGMRADEKIVSAATTINGNTYFTSIIASPNITGCVAPSPLPSSYLYAVNMHTARGFYFGDAIGVNDPPAQRYKSIGDGKLAFQQLDPFVATDGDVTMILPGGDEEDLKGSDGEDKKLQGAGSYWRTEGQ